MGCYDENMYHIVIDTIVGAEISFARGKKELRKKVKDIENDDDLCIIHIVKGKGINIKEVA